MKPLLRNRSFLFAVCLLLCFTTGCPLTPKQLDAKKAAAYDIQQSIDGFEATLETLVVTKRIDPALAKELATGTKQVNAINDKLIDAAFAANTNNSNSSSLVVAMIPQLRAAISAFINSGAVVRNRANQAAIDSLVQTLIKDLEAISGHPETL